VLKVLTSADKTEAIVDLLEQRDSSAAGFRLVLIPVEATLPLAESGQPDARPEAPPAG